MRGANGPLLGYVNFSEIVRGVFQACYMGYALAESAQGQGYMTEACGAAIDYIFHEVRLHRIMANYMRTTRGVPPCCGVSGLRLRERRGSTYIWPAHGKTTC